MAPQRKSPVWTQAEAGERGGGFVPLKGNLAADTFVSGDAAWNVAGPNANPAPAAVEDRQIQLAITPYGWVKAAMNANPTAESKTVDGKKMTVVSFLWKGKYKINGYVDDQNMLEKVETWTPQPILGDMPIEADYSDYKDFSGVKFPMKIGTEAGRLPCPGPDGHRRPAKRARQHPGSAKRKDRHGTTCGRGKPAAGSRCVDCPGGRGSELGRGVQGLRGLCGRICQRTTIFGGARRDKKTDSQQTDYVCS